MGVLSNAAIEQCLKQPMDVDYHDVPLREVADDLRQRTGVPIVIDMPSLEEEGISVDRPVSLKLEGVALKSVLNIMLHQLHLTFSMDDGVVEITSQRAHDSRLPLIRQTYPVSDLLTVGEEGKAHIDLEARDSLIQLIVSIKPESWSVVGGRGTLEFLAAENALIVNQTPEMQEQVQAWLDALRSLPGRNLHDKLREQ